MITEYAKKYENMFTPEQKKYGGYAFIVTEIVMNKEIAFKWRF